MALAIGDPAPPFTLPDQDGKPVDLVSFQGRRVVIYFYPKDDTPGCTKEACNFRDRWSSLEEHPEGKLERIYRQVKAETMADHILKDLGLA